MPEPFEIVDPVERFAEARQEAVSDGLETTRSDSQTRRKQALWWGGAAIYAICALILVTILYSRAGDNAARIDNSSDTSPPPSRQPGSNEPALRATSATPQTQSIHAIDPDAPAVKSLDEQPETRQQVQASPPDHPADRRPAIAQATGAQNPSGFAEQPVKLPSAASIRNGPSASADIIGTVYSRAEVHIAARTPGWVQIVDPSSGRTGWIDARVLSPSMPAVESASTEDPPSEDDPSGMLNEPLEQNSTVPEENALSEDTEAKPAPKVKKHSAKRQYGRKRFAVRFKLRRILRRF